MDSGMFLSYRNWDAQNAPMTPQTGGPPGGRAVWVQRFKSTQQLRGALTSWATAGTRTASQTCWRTDGWWCRWRMGTAEVCSFAEPGASTHASVQSVPGVFPSLINTATESSGTQDLWFKSLKGTQTFSVPQNLSELTHVTFPVPLVRSSTSGLKSFKGIFIR